MYHSDNLWDKQVIYWKLYNCWKNKTGKGTIMWGSNPECDNDESCNCGCQGTTASGLAVAGGVKRIDDSKQTPCRSTKKTKSTGMKKDVDNEQTHVIKKSQSVGQNKQTTSKQVRVVKCSNSGEVRCNVCDGRVNDLNANPDPCKICKLQFHYMCGSGSFGKKLICR